MCLSLLRRENKYNFKSCSSCVVCNFFFITSSIVFIIYLLLFCYADVPVYIFCATDWGNLSPMERKFYYINHQILKSCKQPLCTGHETLKEKWISTMIFCLFASGLERCIVNLFHWLLVKCTLSPVCICIVQQVLIQLGKQVRKTTYINRRHNWLWIITHLMAVNFLVFPTIMLDIMLIM